MHTIVHYIHVHTCTCTKSRICFWSVIHCFIYCTGEWKDNYLPIKDKRNSKNVQSEQVSVASTSLSNEN